MYFDFYLFGDHSKNPWALHGGADTDTDTSGQSGTRPVRAQSDLPRNPAPRDPSTFSGTVRKETIYAGLEKPSTS